MAGAVADRPGQTPSASAGLFSQLARAQYAALAWLQYRILINSLRTKRGGVELGARVLTFLIFGVVALGPAVGMGFGACLLTLRGELRGVAALLWILCLVWQVFSALAPALAGQNPELNHLLRYPVSFGSWILLYLVHGLAAPSTLIGLLWAAAITIGVSVARPDHAVWTALTLLVFGLFNLLLARTVLSWIERWMAQRRTREILTGIFLVVALAAQFLNPALHPAHRGTFFGLRQKTVARLSAAVWNAQKALPPGLAYASIVGAENGRRLAAAESLGWLGLCSLAVGGLLGVRLRAECRGENLSEVSRSSSSASMPRLRSRRILDFSGPVAAVIEKDLRYLLRSGPMLYNLATPLLMVFLFGGAIRTGRYAAWRVEYALPVGMIWAFLGLTRLIANNLGGDGEGVQFYFLSPTPLRTVVFGKNLLHVLIFLVEAALIAVLVTVRSGAPAPAVAAATVAWLLFAVPANLAAGNVLSIVMPYRMNLARMRRESGALGNGLLSMLAQFLILAAGAAVLVPCAAFGHPWLATPLLLLLAGLGAGAYLLVLQRVDGMMQARMESLTGDLARAARAV